MAKHKHYDCIVAWAEGKQIQFNNGGGWEDCPIHALLSWDNHTEFRVKPEPKPDITSYFIALSGESLSGKSLKFETADYNLALTFDGETGKLKAARVINQD